MDQRDLSKEKKNLGFSLLLEREIIERKCEREMIVGETLALRGVYIGVTFCN